MDPLQEMGRAIKEMAGGMKKMAERVTQVDQKHDKRYDDVDGRLDRLEKRNDGGGDEGG